MRLTRAQAAARAALLELQSRPPLDPPDLGAIVAETLRSAVGWDSHRLFTIDPASGAFSRLLESSAGDETSRAIWLRETYLGTESAMIATIERLAGASTLPKAMAIQADLAGCHGWPLRSWDDAEQRRFRELFVEGSERYRLPGRLSGAATLSPVANGVVVGHLVAWRLEPARPFSVGDIAFLNLVAGLVGELIETSIRADRQRPAEVPDGSGVVLLGPDGGLRYASPLGESWLRTLRGAEANVATDLPGQVWSAVAWLRTGAAQSSLHASVPGGEAVIQATSGGGDGSLALVIAPGPPAPAVQVPVAWRLTPAEARVATLVAQGLSNREVAECLSVSENTVVWHLRHVFATTGLTSRTQLAARVLRGSRMAGDG